MRFVSNIFHIKCFTFSEHRCAEYSLYIDPDDCGAYYQCSGGKRIRFVCGNGFMYDVITESCVSQGTHNNCYSKEHFVGRKEEKGASSLGILSY